MEKLTLKQLGERKDWTTAIIVITEDSFNKPYTEFERSYKVASNAKFFDPTMIGNSLYADALDGTDEGVRLEAYIASKSFTVEYCYIPLEMELINYFDVWGNADHEEDEDGTNWNVNNLCSEGNVFLKSTSKEHVLQTLKDKGFIKETATLDDVYIDYPGESRIEIEQAEDYKPLFALRDI